jgi:hypothetical protein
LMLSKSIGTSNRAQSFLSSGAMLDWGQVKE